MHVSLNAIREGVAPNAEIQGRGDDGAGSEESIGNSTLWGDQQYGHYQRVLISRSVLGFDFDFDMAYFFGGVSEERRPWIP